MQIQKVSITQINPAPYNPRLDLKPGDPAYEKLKQSVTEFGCVEPMIWNERTRNLVGGHQRLKVLLEQGITEVEVSVVDLPLEREKALNVALNQIQGDWDEQKLSAILEELSKVPEFDVGLTGFNMPEISEILDRQQQPLEDDFDVEAAAVDIDTPVTQPGDLIELGRHRLMCGDSANTKDLARLIRKAQIQVLHSDPPYSVAYLGGNRPNPAKARPKRSRNWELIYNDNLSQPKYEKWLKRVFTNATPHLAKGASIYIWNGHRQFGPMHQMLIGLGFRIACVITWAKPNFAIGYGDYNQQTEFCLYGWKADGPHTWYGPTNESTLWEVKRDPTAGYHHPTQKPLVLAERALRNSSQRGDLVLDLFGGSGSTLIAADILLRRCFMMEIEPKWCDVIVKRFLAFAKEGSNLAELRKRYLPETCHDQA